ncbi:MAG TPA: HAD family hydrolase [Leucothrix mucor]|nr:HAD family hydrolase [Leucothrix mucor]
MHNKYQLIIFDWDGTLMDSTAQIVNCMQLSIKKMDAAPRSDDAILNIIGLGLEEAILALYPTSNNSFINKAAEVYRDYYLFKDKTPSPLFAGVIEMLDELREQNYDLAIATGKSRRGLDKGLDETNLHDYFPITRCADETRSKPDPQMLTEILTDYNSCKTAALMIGDSKYDLQMANNAKMDSIAVSYGVHSLERLLKHKPVAHVKNARSISTQIRTLNEQR